MFCTTNIIYDPSVPTNTIPVSLDCTLEMEKEDGDMVACAESKTNNNNNNKKLETTTTKTHTHTIQIELYLSVRESCNKTRLVTLENKVCLTRLSAAFHKELDK